MQSAGFFVFLIYIALVFIRPQEYMSGLKGLPIPLTAEALTILFWMMGKKRFDAPQYKSLVMLTVVIFISSALAVGIHLSATKTIDFIMQEVMVFFFLTCFLDTPERQKKFIKVFVAGTTLISVHSVLQSMNPDHMGWTGVKMDVRHDSGPVPIWQIRYLGIFSDPNDLGMTIDCAIPMIVYLFLEARGKFGRLFLLGLLGLHFYTVYLTNSRGTVLAAAAEIGCWGILRYGGIKVLVPSALVAFIAPMLLPSRMSLSNDASSHDRILAWHTGLRLLREHPLFGVGKDRFHEHFFLNLTAHNSWVLAFSELGFLGFYFWISLLFVSFHMVWTFRSAVTPALENAKTHVDYSKERALAAVTMYSMVGVFVSAFFISRTYTVILYIMAGLATAQYHRVRRDFPDIELRSQWGRMFFISIGFIVLIQVIVRLKS